MFVWRRTLAGLAMAVVLTAPVHADVIISNLNGNDLSASALLDDLRNKAMAFLMPPGPDYVLDSVTLRLNPRGAGIDPVVQIWSDVGGLPSASLVTLTDPASFGTGFANYVFTAPGTFTLNDSTKYWLMVYGVVGAEVFDWLASNPGITPTGIASHAGSLFDDNGPPPTNGSAILNSYAINAHSTEVPIPGTLALFGLGLAGLGWSRCKK